jgi:GDP-4-dehydro-6-deoxy-D-mannose reductase
MTSPRCILITGASGFVGQHLEAALAAAYPGAVLATAAFDLRDPAAVGAAVRAAAPDACIHLAAVANVTAAREDEPRTWQVNLQGTLQLAWAIRHCAPACQLVFASSADAYGDARNDGMIDENVPLAPRNVYAATKAAADLALGAMAAQGLKVVRLRLFNHTGPGQSADYVVAAFARQVARIEAGVQEPVVQVGNLESWRDFLDVRDVCRAYAACIGKREEVPAGTVLNIGSGEARRIGDVLAELMHMAGVEAEVRTAGSRVRSGEQSHARADIRQAGEVLGWWPSVPWTETLRTVLEDWRTRVAADGREA